MVVAGGRWGQRPAAHRMFALSGVLFFGGLVLALTDLAIRDGSPGPVFVAGNVLVIAGLLLVTLAEPLLRHRDERHAQHIHRSVGRR